MSYENEYLLVGSEALSREFNDVASYYSDFHKEVYGFRPRSMALCACDYPDHNSLVEAMSHLKRLVDGLNDASERVFADREQAQKMAIDDFEAYLLNCIKVGARDRVDAVAWICDSYGVANEPGQMGWESLEYTTGVPFGYIQKSLQVQNDY
jgi:hypothetical protein